MFDSSFHFFYGLFRSRGSGISQGFIHRIHHRLAGNRGAGNGINRGRSFLLIRFSDGKRRCLAHKLSGELRLLRAGAQAGGFLELVVANYQLLDAAVFVDGHLYGHRAFKALLGRCFHVCQVCFRLGRLRFLCFRHCGGLCHFTSVSLGLFVGLVNGLQHRIGGDGGAGNGLNIILAEGKLLSDKLLDKLRLQSACTIAFCFIEAVVPNDQVADGPLICDGGCYRHRAAKALLGGGVGLALRRCGAHSVLLFKGLVDGVQHRSGGDGGAGNGLDVILAEGKLLPNKLIGEDVFQSTRAIAFRFGELVVPHLQLADCAILLDRDKHSHRSGKTLLGGGVGGAFRSDDRLIRAGVEDGINLLGNAVDPAHHRV